MSVLAAVSTLFVAFNAQRNTDQARLYVTELEREARCGDCAEIAASNLTRSARRLPSLAELLTEAREVTGSAIHTSHILSPQLAPRSETWWRSEAVKLISPHVGHDRNLAAFIAAQMWWSDVRPEFVAEEIKAPIWIDAARALTADKDLPSLVEAAFRRARWAEENQGSTEIPESLLMLKEPA